MRILIIEDDKALGEALSLGLEKEGQTVTHRLTAAAGEAELTERPEAYDVLILDWLLPDKDGIELCHELRARGLTLPIILLTGKSDAEDKVTALNAGADDYLTKPFAFPELSVRLQALGRRPRRVLSAALALGPLTLDTERKVLYHHHQEIPLTLKEFAIAEYLMRHPNQVMTREQILDHVWDYNFDSFSNIVDVHINNLRKKITAAGSPSILETIRGVGYCVRTLA